MKRIVVLDTWINDSNLGNKIIVEAVLQELREVFPQDFIYQVPAMEYVKAGRNLVRQADYVFAAGTNLLRADMNYKARDWRLRITDTFWEKGVILLGVGWCKYQSFPPNRYTRLLLRRILKQECYHSVRDSYTANRLKALGYDVKNTGCPTIWRLSQAHCAQISDTKAKNALLTFTMYRKKPVDDRLLFEIVTRNYDTVYFWPQMYEDYFYAKEICGNKLVFIPPSVEALDDLLQSEDVDYVGTRLHAGIRALQHKRRAIIIAVDNRATEMGKDFNLPVVPREKLALQLEDKANARWRTEVNVDQQIITAWKKQLITSVSGSESTLNVIRVTRLKGIARRVLPAGTRNTLWRFLPYSLRNAVWRAVRQASE